MAIAMGMTKAEIYVQLNQLESTILTALEFQTQIIFGWLVAMFFVAHRLSRPQISVACIFFLGISLMNLAVIVSAISRAETWQDYLFPTSNVVAMPSDMTDIFLDVISSGWLQLAFMLSVYAACIWWAISCRRNQSNVIGSPL